VVARRRVRDAGARAEEFRRCRTSRSDDGCAALTGGTAASSKLNSRSPADAVLEGTKRSEYTVSLFPLDPGGFVSGADIVYDARARTEARSGRAEHVGTPRLRAVANSEEAPYPTFRRFPCVSAPHASPRRSRARRCRARFASRCPIRARVPTTSRASRCGLLRASSLCGDSFVRPKSGCRASERTPRCTRGSVCLALAVFPAPSLKKQVNTVPLSICVSSHAKASFERENGGFSVEKTTRQRRGNPKLFAVFFRVIRTQRKYYARDFLRGCDGRPTIFYFFPFRARRYLNISTSALRRGGDYPRVACIYIQQPRQHSTGSITLRHNNEQTSIRPTRRRRGRQTIQQVTLSRARGAT